jgi:hypothetical protein
MGSSINGSVKVWLRHAIVANPNAVGSCELTKLRSNVFEGRISAIANDFFHSLADAALAEQS